MPSIVRRAATLLVCAALVGCAASEDSAPVTVVLLSGSQLADAPSSFIVRIAAAGSGDEVRATATEAVTVEQGEGLVLLDDALPPGRYRVEALQQGCGMDGDDCPDDPSSSEFVGTHSWRCSVAFDATTGRRTRIEVLEGSDPEATDRWVCRVVA